MAQIANKRVAATATSGAAAPRPFQKNSTTAIRKVYPPTHGRTISEDIAEYLSGMQRPPSRRWSGN